MQSGTTKRRINIRPYYQRHGDTPLYLKNRITKQQDAESLPRRKFKDIFRALLRMQLLREIVFKANLFDTTQL